MEQAAQFTAPTYPSLELGPRTIPIPEHVSSEAQQLIAMPRLNLLPSSYPPLHDKAAWRKSIAEVNAAMKTMEDLAAIPTQFQSLRLPPRPIARFSINRKRRVPNAPSSFCRLL